MIAAKVIQRVFVLKKQFSESVMDWMTYDRIARRMKGQGFDPENCTLGEVMCAVRKELRAVLTKKIT